MPRLRPDRPSFAFGLGAFAAIAFVGSALAQTSPETAPENGLFDPPSGQGVLVPEEGGGSSAAPISRTFGNPPGFGASATGFDSTNARRKVQAAAAARNAQQRLPPVVTTRATPEPPLPPAAALPPERPADPMTTGSVGPPYAPPYAPPARKPKSPEIDPYEPLGIRAGAFILRPAIETTGGYDSNPEREPKAKGSLFYKVEPELKAISDWERHEFRASLRGSYVGFAEDSSLNRPFFESILDGRVDITSQTRAELQGRFQYSVDLPGSPNFEANVSKPTPYTNSGGTAGLFHRFNRLEIGGKVSIDRTQYDDSTLTDGTIVNNEDRNFTTRGVELRGSYDLLPGVKPFVAAAADKRTYDLSVDAAGVNRDSTGLTPRVGSSFEISRKLTGEVSVGYTQRKYEDPQLEDINGIVADASLIWTATALTTLKLTATTTVYESIDSGVSGVLSRDFGAQVDHAFRDWLIGTLKFGYGIDEYVGTPQVDNRYTLGAGLIYKMNRNVQWKGEIRREQRTSNVPNNDYVANIFLLGLRLQD